MTWISPLRERAPRVRRARWRREKKRARRALGRPLASVAELRLSAAVTSAAAAAAAAAAAGAALSPSAPPFVFVRRALLQPRLLLTLSPPARRGARCCAH